MTYEDDVIDEIGRTNDDNTSDDDNEPRAVPLEVALTFEEMKIAGQIGLDRHIASLKAQHVNQYPGHTPWDIHIEAAMAEMALLKVLGLLGKGELPKINTFKGPDVDPDIQARLRRPDRTRNDLFMGKKDNPLHYYVNMIGHEGVYRIEGYVRGREAMLPKYEYTGNLKHGWYFPNRLLRDIRELIAERRED